MLDIAVVVNTSDGQFDVEPYAWENDQAVLKLTNLCTYALQSPEEVIEQIEYLKTIYQLANLTYVDLEKDETASVLEIPFPQPKYVTESVHVYEFSYNNLTNDTDLSPLLSRYFAINHGIICSFVAYVLDGELCLDVKGRTPLEDGTARDLVIEALEVEEQDNFEEMLLSQVFGIDTTFTVNAETNDILIYQPSESLEYI